MTFSARIKHPGVDLGDLCSSRCSWSMACAGHTLRVPLCRRSLPKATRFLRVTASESINRHTGSNSAAASRGNPTGSNSSATSHSGAADLASYSLRRRSGATAPWLQRCIRHIVKRTDEAPFLQMVHLRPEGERSSLCTFAIEPEVVAVPQLWQGVAATLHNVSPEIVILVQKVKSAAEAQQQQQQKLALRAENACRRLMASGVAEAILEGKVGDCCTDTDSDDDFPAVVAAGAEDEKASASGGSCDIAHRPHCQEESGIVPWGSLRRAVRRRAVRAAALGPPSLAACGLEPGSCPQYFGVVVQSKGGAAGGAEGAYLLKTVRNVAPTGCACTHYSLTRINAGCGDLEQQFVKSWLA